MAISPGRRPIRELLYQFKGNATTLNATITKAMNTNTSFQLSLTFLLFSTVFISPPLFAQGTAFTYQGRLSDGGNPANGNYDLTFALFSASSGTGQVGSALTNTATAVSNGLFTVILDFGANFPGGDRWLEIGVRTNSGVSGTFSTLLPRQQVTPAPYAITAGNLVSGGIPPGTYGSAVTFSNNTNNFTGGFNGNGSGLTNVNATKLGGLPAARFWQLGGNNASDVDFVGTINNAPLIFKVNSSVALTLWPSDSGAPAVVGGSVGNFAAKGLSSVASGATIAGGGAVSYFSQPTPNYVLDDFGTIGGGCNNVVGAFLPQYDTRFATISGGLNNTIQDGAGASVIGGGEQNNTAGAFATVPGGTLNDAEGDFSFAAGHQAKALHQGAFVWADSAYTDFSSTGPNQFLIRASGGVGIGKANPASALDVNGTTSATSFRVALSTNTLTAGSTLTPTTGFVKVLASSPVTLNTTTAISDGSAVGSLLILMGGSSNAITVPNNANTRLTAARVLTTNSTLTLIWNGFDWLEISFFPG